MSLDKQKIAHLEDENRLLKEYAQALDRQNQTRNQERKVLQAEIAKLLSTSSNNQKENHRQSVQYNNLKAENSRLKQEIEKIKKQLDLAYFNSKSVANSSKQSGSISIEMTNLKNELRQIQSKCTRLQLQKKNIEQELQNRNKQRDSIIKLEATIRSLDSEKYSLNSQLESTRTELKKVQFELGDKSSKIIKLEQQIRQIETQTTRTNQHEKLKIECQNLKSEITNKNGHLLQLTSQIERLQRQSKQSKQQSQRQYQLQISNLNSTIHILNEELLNRKESQSSGQFNEEIIRMEHSINQYVKRISQLQNELITVRNQDYHNDEEMLVKQNEILNQRIDGLSHRIQILEEVNSSLRQQLKNTINMRNQENKRSQIKIQHGDNQLLQTIKYMKIQLNDVRNQNIELNQQINRFKGAKQSKRAVQIKSPTCKKCQMEAKYFKSNEFIESPSFNERITFQRSPIKQEYLTSSHFYSQQNQRVRQDSPHAYTGVNYNFMDDNSHNHTKSQSDNQNSINFNFQDQCITSAANIPQRDTFKGVKIKRMQIGVSPSLQQNTKKQQLQQLQDKQKYKELQRKINALKQQNSSLRLGIYQDRLP